MEEEKKLALPEGELTRTRSALVCEESLVEVAQELGLKPQTVRAAYCRLKRLGIQVGQLPEPAGDTIGARLDPETYVKLQRMVTARVDP